MNNRYLPDTSFYARFFTLFFTVCLVLTASGLRAQGASQPPDPAPATAGEQRPMITMGMNDESIARAWPDSAVWLNTGDSGRVLALFKPEAGDSTKGAIVILSDEGESAASDLANALREALSRKKWGVMTIGLKPPTLGIQQALARRDRELRPEPAMAEKATPEDQGADSVMIDVMDSSKEVAGLQAYRDEVRASLTAAANALREREYKRVILVGIGWAAGHATRQVRDDGQASDLIWVAPRFHADEAEGLTELLSTASSPSILELYSTFPGDRLADRSADERAASLKRAGISGYDRQPVAMARRPKAREANSIASRLSAWLSRDNAASRR